MAAEDDSQTSRIGTPREFSALKAGTQLDQRYTINSVLAAGGFGITYLAEHETLKTRFAVKEHFPRQFAYRDTTTREVHPSDPAVYGWALDRFLQEGQSLAKCKHPNVVGVANIFRENGTAYMVLEFEEGQSLGAWMKALGRPAAQAEVDALLTPILNALGYVHLQGLLHRDIAPDNIMIRRNGQPCLIDFGSARQAIAERSQLMSAIIKSGYSPPEQYTTTGKSQGAWSDIYALGATLYHAITGIVPPEAPERQIHDELIATARAVKSPEKYRPTFLAAIDASLRLRHSERPQSTKAWSASLFGDAAATEIAAAEVTFSALPDARPGAQAPAKSHRLGWGAGLVAMLAVSAMAANIGGVWQTPWQRDTQQNATQVEEKRRADAADAASSIEQERQRLTDERVRTQRAIEDAVREKESASAAKLQAEADARRLRAASLSDLPSATPTQPNTAGSLLSNMVGGRWAIETQSNCSVPRKSYSFVSDGTTITWRDGVGNVDIETVQSNGSAEFGTSTLRSIHTNGQNEPVGTSWTYTRLGIDRVRVKPGGKNPFTLIRCS